MTTIRRLPLLCLLCLTLTLPAMGQTYASLNVRNFGAAGDGTADDTAAFQDALDAAANRDGALVFVPAGDYCITDTLDVPANTHLKGESTRATILRAPNELTFDLLRLDGVRDVTVSHLTLLETDHNYQGAGYGLNITGPSAAILIEQVHAYGFNAGFTIGRAPGQQDTIENVTFRNCRAEAARGWGFGVNHAQQVLLEDCHAFHHRLDGIKLRQFARDVTISGGESSHNGELGPNGNGVDAYAGGDAFVIQNLLVEHNNGSGIYVKTGPLFYSEDDDFGFVRNGYITGVRARYNRGSGIDLNRSGGDVIKPDQDRLPPLLSHVTISGGIFEHNESSGIYVRGRDITILAPVIRRNQQHGINLASAWDVEVIGALIAGNSLQSPGSFYGISIGADPVKGAGHRVKIRGGVINGIDSDEITNGSNYDDFDETPEPTHRNAINIAEGAEDILIDHVTMRHWTHGPHPIRSAVADDAGLLVHYGNADTADTVGGPGSTLVHDGRLHIKTTAPSQTAGWTPIAPHTVGSPGDRPADPAIGQMHFDTDAGRPLWYNGSEWVDAAGN